jgi:DNA-binding transcriptional LysR family regulator
MAAAAQEMSRAMVTRYMAEMRRTTPIRRGLLRVACAQSLAQAVLMPALGRFLQAHPQAAIDLRIDSRAVNLVADGVDLAIRITNDLDPNIVARRLGDCESVVCAAPSYLAAHGTPRHVQDLALHNCLAYSYFGRSLWEFTDADGQPASVPVGGNLSANESQVLLAAVLEGVGIGLQPRYAVAPALASGALQVVLAEWRPASLGIHGLYATRRQMTAALRTLLDALADHFADPAWDRADTASTEEPRAASRAARRSRRHTAGRR